MNELAVRQGFWLPPKLRSKAQLLYAQQMWAWGQDVKYPAGNLLLAYGFSRQRSVPTGQGGSSEYCLQLPSAELRLWSFGLLLKGPQLKIILPRHHFRPRVLSNWPDSGVWKPGQLPESRAVKDEQELLLFKQELQMGCELISRYENWVNQRLGNSYREACFASWPQRPRELIQDMSEQWLSLLND